MTTDNEENLRITTDRLVLRAPVQADVDAVYRAINDWNIIKYLARVPWPYRRADAEEFIQRAISGHLDGGSEMVFVVDDGELAGITSLRGLNTERMVLGYWFAKRAWGRGYATEAVRALVDHTFAAEWGDEVHAEAITENPASMRVLEKVGFVRDGNTQCETRSRGVVAAVAFRLTRAARDGAQ